MPNADPRQARHDQRWIEAYNNGSYDIPPYGVCEYTDSLFPDKANKYTRQVLEVRRPSADNLTTVCVNGPGRIAKGKYGMVTLDYPTYALYEYSLATGETPEVGDEWGTEAKKFTLKKGNTGFQIIGGKVNNGAAAAIRVEKKPGATGGYRFYNNSGETMPAYGLGRVTSFTEDGAYYTIDKPGSTFARMYLINGQDEVEDEAYGTGYFFEPRRVAYRSAAGTPATGESWGPKSGQWTLEKNYYGFTIAGGVDSDAATVKCWQQEVNGVIGKADSAIAHDDEGTVSVWAGAGGSEVDTTVNVTARAMFTDIIAGQMIVLTWFGGGWYITDAKQMLLGKTTASHAKATSGTVAIWSGTPGSESDTGITVSAMNRFANVASGKWVWLNNNGSGWYLVAAECT